MEIPRQYYTEEFKQEAVKLVRESGLSIAEAGRQLSIPAMTLKNWLYRDKNPKVGNSTFRPVTELEAERYVQLTETANDLKQARLYANKIVTQSLRMESLVDDLLSIVS